MPTTCSTERRSADALRALDLDVDPPARNGAIVALVHDAERRLSEVALFAAYLDTPTLQAEVRCALRIADVAATLHGGEFWESDQGRTIGDRANAILADRLQADGVDTDSTTIPLPEYQDAF